MSCSEISIEEFAKITPVSPPKVNKKINPIDQRRLGVHVNLAPWIVASHLNTLIPVGIAMIIVAEVK